ncbi:alpha/beta hydrolase [Terrisporobacter sp.]|uniref:alpha/beta hydrolase n=1 Tax=Terrisporobacter sp. TaxID=1965305 RepID=UPI00260AB7A1|nr:alpha/beta hydrolase [Terrisporobacter sp.]
MKKRKAKSSSQDKYDTFSITMELERPLLYNNEDNAEKNKQENEVNKAKKMKKRFIILLTVLALFVVGFFIWLSNGYTLEKEAQRYLESNSKVQVTVDGNYTYFTPSNMNSTKGFIFYPGEKVDASSYAKLCNMIASYGYKVVAVDMPFNYATFGEDRATKVIEDNPDIKSWVIGGDSLGGTIACKYAIKNKNVEGIVLISSYPTDNLNQLGFDVLSISGSKDSIVNYEELINSKERLPQDTKYVEIEGANHSQFANYGLYDGDEEALINSDEQMNITVNNIVDFLNNIE